MIIIPAVDIRNGRCVRLLQGRADAEMVFSDDPAAMAQKWAQAGAELIHVIDLDGAFSKSPQNFDAIKRIIAKVDTPIQLGGGIRDELTAEKYLNLGIHKIIVGTEATKNPQWVERIADRYPGRVVVAIDARNGWVAIEGWVKDTKVEAVELAKRFEGCGLSHINFTDIHRDGMQTGPNLKQTRQLAEATTIPVVASGGVATIEDIQNLLPLASCGVVGVITGKALYSGTLDFKEALALTQFD